MSEIKEVYTFQGPLSLYDIMLFNSSHFIEEYFQTTYNFLELSPLAFVKIMKKFDKVTEKQVLPIYLKVVESSYFNSSDKVMKLADEVEDLFVKHFAEEDRRRAMKYLKPSHRKESHAVTFFIGEGMSRCNF